jgi:hypothetical protein
VSKAHQSPAGNTTLFLSTPSLADSPCEADHSKNFRLNERVERLKLYTPEIVAALGLDLRPSGGWLRGPSPLRPDSANRSAFSLSPEHGGWLDRPAGESGDLLGLLARLWNLDRKRDFGELLERAEALAGIHAGGAQIAAELKRRRQEQEARRIAQAAGAAPKLIQGPVWRGWKPERVGEAFDRLAAKAGERERELLTGPKYAIPDFPAGLVAPWTYPSALKEGKEELAREGLLYLARDERGSPECVKFKSLARTLKKGKRVSRGVWGSQGALLGADLLPGLPDAGGVVVVVGGEEKALAGNAWAKRLGASVVFVSALFGEGWHRERGPAQAKRLMEAGPARIVLCGDADPAGHKLNAGWREGLIATGWPAERIGAIVWPEGSPAGFDVNDFLVAQGPEALLALIREAPEAPAPPAPSAPRIVGRALRARLAIPESEAVKTPELVRVPLGVIREALRRRLEGIKEGAKLLIAAGPGSGKTYAAARAIARELQRRVQNGEAPRRVLIAAPKDLWPEWRKMLEAAGVAPERIAELPGRNETNCRHAARAAELYQKGQRVGSLLCGRGMADPSDPATKAEGGEAWTPCAALAQAQAAQKGIKAEPGCMGCSGQLGYIAQYEAAKRSRVVLTTPDRLFGVGFDRLESGWTFSLLIVDEGVDRHLLPERRVSTWAAEFWRRRLEKIEGKGAADLPGLGGLSLSEWLARLLAVAPHRAKLLEADRQRRGDTPAAKGPARAPERDAWAAWTAEAWEEALPDPEARRGRLLAEIETLLSALDAEGAGTLPFERAKSLDDAPPVAFRDYFQALARDLKEPVAEPWLLASGSDWLIGEPSAKRLAILADPSRRVAVLDATPSSAARAALTKMGFETFDPQPRDDTRLVQALGPVNGTNHIGPEPERRDGETPERFQARRDAWEAKKRAHEERIAEILASLGIDPEGAGVITHKNRAEHFERLHVGATFGRHRGTNALQSLPAVVLDGRSEPPAEDMARERRLLSRVLAELGAPEPPVHPLIARSKRDERPGLESPRRFVQFVQRGASGSAQAISVPSNGDDKVDSWTLERREREALQCIGRLRGADRADQDEPPGLALIVTSDPLGLIPVDELLEFRGDKKEFETARARLNETRAKEANARDAELIEATERVAIEMLLAGERVSQRALVQRVAQTTGLPAFRRSVERAFERAGISLSELLSHPQKKWRTQADIRIGVASVRHEILGNSAQNETIQPIPLAPERIGELKGDQLAAIVLNGSAARPAQSEKAQGQGEPESAKADPTRKADPAVAVVRAAIEDRAQRQRLIGQLSSSVHDLGWPEGTGARWTQEIEASVQAWHALAAVNDFEDGVASATGRAGSADRPRRRVVFQGPLPRKGPERDTLLDRAAEIVTRAQEGYLCAAAIKKAEWKSQQAAMVSFISKSILRPANSFPAEAQTTQRALAIPPIPPLNQCATMLAGPNPLLGDVGDAKN